MRKRRRLANKMTIMVCAVLIAVSAFFYAPIEAEAGYIGPNNKVGNAYTFSFPSAIFSYSGENRFDWEYFITDSQTTGQYVFRDGTNNFYFSNVKSSSYIPFANMNNGKDIFIKSGKAYLQLQFLIDPNVQIVDGSGMFSAIDFGINEINIVAFGERYPCNFSKLSNGSYSVVCYFLLDNDGISFGISNGSIALEVVSSLSGYAIIDSSYSYSYSNIYIEYGVSTNFSGYAFSYNEYYDDYVTESDIDNQTNELNQATEEQTETMVNGFDTSGGDAVNSDLSTGLNDYQTSEDNLFATATTGMKDFTFFDIESVPAMVSGISFITATMSSWFNQAGGASGVGIVLSILFSVMLVAMVLGLYRWYQSRGGKD